MDKANHYIYHNIFTCILLIPIPVVMGKRPVKYEIDLSLRD